MTPTTSEPMDDVRSHWGMGVFDNDEGPGALQVAQAAKQSKAAGVCPAYVSILALTMSTCHKPHSKAKQYVSV